MIRYLKTSLLAGALALGSAVVPIAAEGQPAQATTCYKSGYGTRLGQVICYGSTVHRGRFTCKRVITFYTITGPWVDEGKSSTGLCRDGYTINAITAETLG